MSDISHFEKFTSECERLARKQVHPRDRKALLLIAEAWLLLAEHSFSETERAEELPSGERWRLAPEALYTILGFARVKLP